MSFVTGMIERSEEHTWMQRTYSTTQSITRLVAIKSASTRFHLFSSLRCRWRELVSLPLLSAPCIASIAPLAKRSLWPTRHFIIFINPPVSSPLSLPHSLNFSIRFVVRILYKLFSYLKNDSLHVRLNLRLVRAYFPKSLVHCISDRYPFFWPFFFFFLLIKSGMRSNEIIIFMYVYATALS